VVPEAHATRCPLHVVLRRSRRVLGDSFEVDEDRYVAIITDERPDGPLGRPHRELGERIVVPDHKIKWDEGNPTGHGVIFIGIWRTGLLLRTAGRRVSRAIREDIKRAVNKLAPHSRLPPTIPKR
jgi:hypothetical protein